MKYRDYRWPCTQEIAFAHGSKGGRATLANITQAGACLIDLPAVEAGDTLLLTIVGRPIEAEVRWTRRGRVGVRFLSRLTAAELAALRNHHAGNSRFRAEPRRQYR